MKKLMMTFAAGMMAAMTFAAQCAGTTLDGNRCKRINVTGWDGFAHELLGRHVAICSRHSRTSALYLWVVNCTKIDDGY